MLLATVGLAPITVHEEIVRIVVVILHSRTPPNTSGPAASLSLTLPFRTTRPQTPRQPKQPPDVVLRSKGGIVPRLAGRPMMADDTAPTPDRPAANQIKRNFRCSLCLPWIVFSPAWSGARL
jgi:hypothetical protein